MDLAVDLDSPVVTYAVVPALIFLARLLDVSLGTLRLLLLARGVRLAAVLGFFEALVWLLAIRQLMGDLAGPLAYVAYAGGFAAGNVVGLYVEARLALGQQVVRMITPHDAAELIASLRAQGFGVTVVTAQGRAGPVFISYTVTNRRDVPDVLRLVDAHAPRAFTTIEDVRGVTAGVFRRSSQALRK